MARGRGQRGNLVKLIVFTVMSMVFICKVDFVGCINTNKVEAFCNTESFQDAELWAEHLEKLINGLINLTPAIGFLSAERYPLLWDSPYTWYGCAACNGHLSPDDCGSCLKTILNAYTKKCCKGRMGIAVKLQDCRMRYEVYAFDVDAC